MDLAQLFKLRKQSSGEKLSPELKVSKQTCRTKLSPELKGGPLLQFGRKFCPTGLLDFEERSKRGDETGIALFMVLAAISVLALLITEFVYISEVNQMIAFGALDQLKVHYLAKSGYKLSLLRLKAYQQVKAYVQTMVGQASQQYGAAGSAVASQAVPSSLIQKIWSFPFIYPIPTSIPGLSTSDKAVIEKFQKDSNMDGNYSAVIQSESSKYNLNMILASYAPSSMPTYAASSSPSPNSVPPALPTPGAPSPSPTSSSPAQPFNPTEARQSLYNYINELFQKRFQTDPDFATTYRDLKIGDLTDQIIAWADLTYERTTSNYQDKVPMKQAPFYSLSELHMIPLMDDELYDFLAPNFTVSPTAGINVNTMNQSTFWALIPNLTQQDVTDFFKYRDSTEAENHFQTVDMFFTYLQKNIPTLQSPEAIQELQQNLKQRNVILVTDESEFKITVEAHVNQASERIEAWVTLEASPQANPSGSPSNSPTMPPNSTLMGMQPGGSIGNGSNMPMYTGLRVNYLKIN